MKVPLNWLREYVDIVLPVDELAEKLTMAGLEVSDIQVIGGEWDNIIVSEIVAIKPHPNADRLRLTTIDLGGKQQTVVCGAPNLVIGDKVPFAGLGAELIDAHEGKRVRLKPAKIRGVASEGMICSERELGLSDSHEGIMVLSPEARPGQPLSELLGDTILDIDLTPNRPDCFSIIGIAREVAALTGQKVHIEEKSYAEGQSAAESFASIEIIDPELCPRYCASILTDIKIGPSPQWMQQRLLACGMRPISNIVDVTNYVNMEYGQPLHAFDLNYVADNHIIVRRARSGEKMATLDGIERQLSENMLVITDKNGPVAVAGIMGGESSEITDATRTVLLESANFNQVIIHEGSTALKLATEASLRFEKGLSKDLALIALRRATQLMVDVCGATAARGIIDVYPGNQPPQTITFSYSEVKRLLGLDLNHQKIKTALESLGFACQKADDDAKIAVTVPWWRTDINCQADLVEEVLRMIGYDTLPATMLSTPIPEGENTPVQGFRVKVREVMLSCGLQEVITYSMTNLDYLKKLSPDLTLNGPEPLKAANPMSREMEYMRTTLRPGVMAVLARNQRYQQKGTGFFEIGNAFIPRENDLPREDEMLCVLVGGLQTDIYWRSKAEDIDFYFTKGIAEAVFTRLRLTAEYVEAEDESLYPGKVAAINVKGTHVGVIGELHPAVASAYDISDTAYLLELDLGKLFALSEPDYYYQTVTRFPGTIRDIALLVDEAVTYQQIEKLIRNISLVKEVTLFDSYQGKQVSAGKKSLAIRLIYQNPERTLSDNEVDKVQKQLLKRLQNETGATLRE